MKLLIDIPEHVYEHAKEASEDSRDEGEAMRAIANGSPARCKGMDEAEKERLIKKNMLSIENRVRHVFNQGYEMGVKKNKSEIPTSCGDAISRQAVLDAMYELCNTGETLKENPWRDNPHIDAVVEAIEELPSVSPKQRTGRWIKDEHGGQYKWVCSNCGTYHRALYDYCPSCGAKMEAEDAD